MKPTSAKEAAQRAAEAKSRAAAKAAEAAEAKKDAEKLRKSRAALEKKLSCALLMAAAEGATSLIWNGDQDVLSTLSERGLWVYERGVFSEFDLTERLKEWRRHSLDAVMLNWIAHPESKIQLSDRKALTKLFGGAQGLASLHTPLWEMFFERIGDEDDSWFWRESSAESFEYEDLVTSSLEKVWRQAVRRGEIDPEMAFKSFSDYTDLYGGELLVVLWQEARRLVNSLDGLLTADRNFTFHVADDFSIRIDRLDELKFDYSNCSIENSSDDFPALFKIDEVPGEEDDREMEGSVLHPSIYRYFNPTIKRSGNFSTLYPVESLEIFWVPSEHDWLPSNDTVNQQLLNWLGGRDGKRFCGDVFGRVENAAQDGENQVEFVLTQLSSSWTLAGDDGRALYSLPPALLALMLSGYGYKVKASSTGKMHRLFVTW